MFRVRAWRTSTARHALFLLGMALACGPSAAQKSADPARGAAKAAACLACHGSAEKPAQAGVPLLAGQHHEFLVLQMFYLREGLRDVPQMAGMLKGYADRDLEDVAAYFARQSLPGRKSSTNGALRARGEDVAKSRGCNGCHLDDYSGQKHVPRIASQGEDYLVLALQSYRDNKRTGTDTSMNEAMYQVSDADIAALAHFLAHR
ncbi:MAG: c-type cytochrome [Betaproteobacteria bacterium]|nr:c-type cytochrome [Betaproteobacteria bacterium]